MSKTKVYSGKFVQLVPDTWTLEDYCKFIADCENLNLTDYYESYLDLITNEMSEKYFTYKDKLYMFLNITEGDADDSFIKINQSGRIYEFTTSFYNGVTCLSEMIEEGLDKL